MLAVGGISIGSGHISGLTNPCPGVEDVELVIVNTGGPPWPLTRTPTKKWARCVSVPLT